VPLCITAIGSKVTACVFRVGERGSFPFREARKSAHCSLSLPASPALSPGRYSRSPLRGAPIFPISSRSGIRQAAIPCRFSLERRIQALGYLFESHRARSEGEWLQDFVLLPEAGSFFHPAHRFGDQTIVVHLAPDARVRFSSRALVWVWGTFRASAGDPAGSKPLYTLELARVHPAGSEEIRQYFK